MFDLEKNAGGIAAEANTELERLEKIRDALKTDPSNLTLLNSNVTGDSDPYSFSPCSFWQQYQLVLCVVAAHQNKTIHVNI